jgi:uncharacterized protein DUF6894
MARYFFHTEDGECFPDVHGSELPDLDAVRRTAVQAFVEMQQALQGRLWGEGGLRMIVNDEAGLTLFVLEMSVINAPAIGSADAAQTRIR